MNKINKYDLKIGDVVVITNFEKNTDEWSSHYKGKVSVISRVDYPFYYLENDDTTTFTKEQLCVISTKDNMKYKIGDKVQIKNLDWYNEHKNETDDIECSNNIWFYREMSKFCGKVMTISHVGVDYYTMVEDLVGYWTDEMIECKVEDETKPKFKVGDKIKWFNHTCNITAIDTNENIYTYLIKHNDYREDKIFAKWVPENELTFEDNEETPIKIEGKIIKSNEMVVSIGEYTLPDGYIFKDENGNVINATKIVLEKKKKEVILTQEQIDTMVHESCVLFCKHCGCGVPRETCTSLGTCKDHDEYRESMRTYFEKHKK